MIEIKCTKTQKRKIIEALKGMGLPCLFPRKMEWCALDPNAKCEECLETKIKWRIES